MSNNKLPLVSFAIPSYNHEKYIGEMLDSCLTQTYPNIEVVVVDDASTDNSRQVIEEYTRRYPGTIRAEFNATNLGQALTARKAVQLSRGEYIAGIGSDDVSLPHRIAAGVNLLLADPALGAVFSKAEIIDETGRTIDSSIAQVFNCEYDDIRWRLLSGNFLCGPSMLVRGDLVRKISPNPSLRFVEDFDQCLRILDKHELLRVDDIWVKYRSHGRNLSIHTQATVPFAGNYETAICILSALVRWPVHKLFAFQSAPGSPEYKKELAVAHCKLAEHCIRMDDALFGRPFLLTSEAYRQILIATENDPHNERATKLLSEVWSRLGDQPRATGKKPITFVTWQEQQAGSANPFGNGSAYATSRSPTNFDDGYARWQQNRNFVPGDTTIIEGSTAQWTHVPRIHLVMRLAQGLEKFLADTLDSLIQQIYGEWHLDIVTPLPSPEGLDELPCIGWNNVGTVEESKGAIDNLVSTRNFDWVIELPAGAKLDRLCLWRLAVEANAQPDARVLFVDDDCCDGAGRRHSPRFKPGNNPAALQSSDLAGPICVRRDTWEAVGGTSFKSGSPWFSLLLQITEQFGWQAICHVPDVLISYTNNFPTDTESCLVAQLEINKGTTNEIIPVTGQSWCVRSALPKDSMVSIAILSQGALDFLSNCFNSIVHKTTNIDFEILIAYTLEGPDAELQAWLNEMQRKFPQLRRIVEVAGNKSYAARCNAAVEAATYRYVVLIREEAYVEQSNWLEELVRTCAQPGIAGVSPKLLQPYSHDIESGGIVIGLKQAVGSLYRGEAKEGDRGYLDCLKVARDVSTLHEACMLVRRDAYLSVHGMDDQFLGDHLAEVDLSLKLRRNGDRLIYQPLSTIVYEGKHKFSLESDVAPTTNDMLEKSQATGIFESRWKKEATVDPFFNPNLSLASPTPALEDKYGAPWRHLPCAVPHVFAQPLINGQGIFRITSPLACARKAGLAQECIWPQDDNRTPTAAEIQRLAPDTVIVQHYIFDRHLSALHEWKTSPSTPFTVYSMDDLISDLGETHPYKKNLPSDSRARLRYALKHCDRLVTSTDFLADYYSRFISDIRVVPNRLDPEIWLPLRADKRASGRPRIGWAGGETHLNDLILLKAVIERTRHEADWIFFGLCPDEIRPLLTEYHAFTDFSEYPARLAALNLDIAVAPLAQTPFNQGKSNLRLLEYGALGIPIVCTDIDPFRNSPACRVANNTDAWIEALRERIHDPEAREREGAAMQAWVREYFFLEPRHLTGWLSDHLP